MSAIRQVIQFLMTIQFGVILLLVLMVVMMFATQFEATFGTQAMKTLIYGSAWFDFAVFLFVVNIIVNTWRRRPFKFRHTGFLTVHAGVLIIVAGGLMTRWYGIDGTMPIPEGTEAREISLPDNDLVVHHGDARTAYKTDYELLPTRNEHDDLFAVPGTPYHLRVTTYYPSGSIADTLINDAAEENPMIQLAVGGSGEPAGGWLAARDPIRNTLSGGPARVTFVEPSGLAALQQRWERSVEDQPAPENAGTLEIHWTDGTSERLLVPQDAEELDTSREGVTVHVVQVFRSFTLTGEGHADAVDKPANPAIRFHVSGPDGTEDHFSFTAFPEFRISPPEGETWLVSHAGWEPDPAALDAVGRDAEVAVVREDAGRYTTWTSWNDPTDGALLSIGETRSFPGRSVLLRILDEAERGRLTRTVRKVSDELIRPVIKVQLVQEAPDEGIRAASFVDRLRGRPAVRPLDTTPNEAWIFHGENFRFDTPEGPVQVGYEGRSIPLDFAIHLEDFREEKYPGISMAASFESHVMVQPDDGEPFATEIYMNHPLIYEGYTFYQASFQRRPSGEEITVLSVARDPGMTVSFFGYCVLVVGLVLIFFVKPYFRKLDDRIARSRAASLQGAQT